MTNKRCTENVKAEYNHETQRSRYQPLRTHNDANGIACYRVLKGGHKASVMKCLLLLMRQLVAIHSASVQRDVTKKVEGVGDALKSVKIVAHTQGADSAGVDRFRKHIEDNLKYVKRRRARQRHVWPPPQLPIQPLTCPVNDRYARGIALCDFLVAVVVIVVIIAITVILFVFGGVVPMRVARSRHARRASGSAALQLSGAVPARADNVEATGGRLGVAEMIRGDVANDGHVKAWCDVSAWPLARSRRR
jgi:hypothetical protein